MVKSTFCFKEDGIALAGRLISLHRNVLSGRHRRSGDSASDRTRFLLSLAMRKDWAITNCGIGTVAANAAVCIGYVSVIDAASNGSMSEGLQCRSDITLGSVGVWKSCVCRARGRRRGQTREHETSPKAFRDIRYLVIHNMNMGETPKFHYWVENTWCFGYGI